MSEYGDPNDPNDTSILCSGCRDGAHCDGAVDWCECPCGWDEDWAE